MKKILFSIISILLFNNANALTYVDKHLGNNEIQGLKYIKDTAHTHMARYNKKYRTKWRAFEPDTRTLVSKCAVPLTASWYKAKQIDVIKSFDKQSWYIKVSCAKIVESSYDEDKSWYVVVPTDRPIKKAIRKK